MSNSAMRHARLSTVLATGFTFAIGLSFVLSPATAKANSATTTNPSSQVSSRPSAPPQQITISFSEKDNLIQRLLHEGVSESDAHSIDKAVRRSLTLVQRQAGALIELSFGGDQWPWTIQTIAIEPLNGSVVTLDAKSIAAPVAQVSPVPRVAPVLPVTVPQAAPIPQVASISVPASTPAPTAAISGKAVTTVPGKQVDAATLTDPFGDGTSTNKLAPATGSIDPEWPVRPPKVAATGKPGQPLTVVHGVLGSDVDRSLLSAGLPARIASEISQAVTLHLPLRNVSLRGSRFDVAYEPMPDASVGFILAEFSVNGGRERIWRYRPEGGVPGFYTDDGQRIGGLAMQSPVPGAPIVSPYGMRNHPVLHVAKMHWGVDYAAAMGTPILAAADGTVEDVRRLGNYGLYIRLSHSEGIETTYGHMSKFEQGIKAGTQVKAGDVIGYAGRSGLASGPHLYFEVFLDGKRVDPTPIVSDQPVRLGATDLAEFENLKQRATAVQTADQRQ